MADTETVYNDKENKLFESFCNKISLMVYSKKLGYEEKLKQILENLIALDFSACHVKKERGLLLINHCISIIYPDNTELSVKGAKLFINLVTRGCLRVEGQTLCSALLWCSLCLKLKKNEIIFLKCMQALAKGSGKKIEEENFPFLSDIEKLSNNFTLSSGSEEISLNCLRYVEALTSFPATKSDTLTKESILRFFAIFKNILYNGQKYIVKDEIVLCKFLITAMRGLGNLLQMSDDIVSNHLGDVLGIIKGYMLYGLLGQENYELQILFPTSTSIPEVLKASFQSVQKLRGKYDRRSKKVTVSSINDIGENEDTKISNDYLKFSENSTVEPYLNYKTSDSDLSDYEIFSNSKLTSFKARVRHCALILLGTVVEKANPKNFIAYMPYFLPDGSQFEHMRTLITCLSNDPCSKCRSEVVGVLLMIIFNCRQYFALADGISKSSFTSFSGTISNILKELHKCLIISIKSEKHCTIIKRILKAISDLVRCTPYHKVDPTLIKNISENVRIYLTHKDVNVQIFALSIFGCIISVEPKFKEVTEIILNNKSTDKNISSGNCYNNSNEGIVDDFENYNDDELETITEKPWLLDLCLQNLMSKNSLCDTLTNVALQVESLQVVGALVRNFFKETIVDFSSQIIELLHYCSNKTEYSLRLYSGKLIETVLDSLQFNICHEDENKRAPVSLAINFWETLLQGPITKLIQNQEEPMLRCTGCDCIATLGIQNKTGSTLTCQSSLLFDQLSRDKQILAVTLLYGCLRDESPGVRSSAVRALAIFVLFQSLREDNLFFLDAIDATISVSNDEHSVVRTQASWLFGNLSESVVINQKNNLVEGISIDIVAKLLKTGITLANSESKIKPGAVRGIGNLLRTVNDDFLKKYKEIIITSLEVLIKIATTCTFMKARWNSCYAIANLVQNPIIYSNSEWMSKIFNVMISLVQHYKNFKVRISAGLVLGMPPNRESYGDQYNNVWSAVLNALENSKNISDFNEYQHRDQLVDQLCLVLCHLLSSISCNDLNSLQDVIYFHLDNLEHFMKKFHERIVPEKSNILLKATERIYLLMDEKELSKEEKSLLRILQSIFVNEN